MNDLKESIKDIIRERLTSPFYGTFLIIFILHHWNFFVTLFFVSEKYIFEKENILKSEHLQNILSQNLLCNITIDLFITFFVIIFFPLITRFFYWVNSRHDKKTFAIYDNTIKYKEYFIPDLDKKDRDFFIGAMKKAEKIIYGNSNGEYDISNLYHPNYMDGDILAFLFAHGLVSYESNRQLKFTKKGEYWLSYSFNKEEKNKGMLEKIYSFLTHLV